MNSGTQTADFQRAESPLFVAVCANIVDGRASDSESRDTDILRGKTMSDTKTILFYAHVFCADEADYLRLAQKATPDQLRALAEKETVAKPQ